MIKKILLTGFGVLIYYCSFTQSVWPPVYEIKSDTVLFEELSSDYWQILEDRSGTLNIDNVQALPLTDSFYSYSKRKDQEGIHYVWFRFKLKNISSFPREISLSSQSSQADFYFLKDSSAISHLVTGNHFSWSKKDGLKRANAVPLMMSPGEQVTVYFRWYKLNASFRDQSDSLKLRIFNTQKLNQAELNLYESGWLPPVSFPYSFLVGFFVLAAILNFLIFLAARERLYLYFSLFLLSISISNNPLFTEIMPREYPLTADFISRLSMSWLFFVLYFIRHYFRTFEAFPKWDKMMVILSIVFLINMIIPPVPMDFFYRPEIITIKAFVLGLYILGFTITVVKCMLLSNPGKRAFIIAALPFLIIFVGALLMFIIFLGKIDMNSGDIGNYLNYLFGLAIAWVVVMFSWYLYKRYAGQQKQISEAMLEKERIERKAQEERNELIASQKEELEKQVIERTEDLKKSLEELKATQAQLIHTEKMASLGELTAGIAHEIQNPLNFVNNFSQINDELIKEFEEASRYEQRDARNEAEIIATIKQNSEKINQHGKRAESIVKGMLQHSRKSTGTKELTDINALADEYMRLSYHGLHAKDKSFNAVPIAIGIKMDLDPTLPIVNVVPPDIGRVLLNLFNNAFWAVNEKRKTLNKIRSGSTNQTGNDFAFDSPSGGGVKNIR
ncbi:MAG: 7TM diverse intracellular signaling domain-containing protein [Saprospiraceae bacterium]